MPDTVSARALISIHAPAKGATFHWFAIVQHVNYFNPRSREGSDCSLRDAGEHVDNFNPRSREGSDIFFNKTPINITISIHAPAKGATDMVIRDCDISRISIHAPAKGATSCSERAVIDADYFNPRSREGSDTASTNLHNGQPEFQSTLPRRERLCGMVTVNIEREISIHAPAKGATGKHAHIPIRHTDFNPRSREGSDQMRRVCKDFIKISIHAPAKGATAFINIFSLAVRLFFISSHQ